MKSFVWSCFTFSFKHTSIFTFIFYIQVNEAVVTGWLFFRYLVIGGCVNCINVALALIDVMYLMGNTV